MFCPVCKSEYRDGFTHCSDCDVDLVSSLPAVKDEPQGEATEREEQESDDLTFVPVLSTFNLGDIALLRSILDEQGIEYYLQGENTAYIRGYMDPTILMVREDQVEITRELLKDFDMKFTLFSTKTDNSEQI